MKQLESLVLAVSLLSPFAFAQDPAKLPDNSAQMKRLSWLVGTWEGKGEMEGYGKYSFKYVLAWTLSKNFLKADYRMNVADKTMWYDTAMVGWDKDAKKFVSFVFGMDGTIGKSAEIDPKTVGLTPKKDKNVIVFQGQISGNSPWKKFRTILVQVDKNTFEIDTHVWKDGKYVSMGKAKAHRTPDKKPR